MSNNTLLSEIAENEYVDDLFITFPKKHILLDNFEVINSSKPPKFVGPKADYKCTSIQIANFLMENCVGKVIQHVLD